MFSHVLISGTNVERVVSIVNHDFRKIISFTGSGWWNSHNTCVKHNRYFFYIATTFSAYKKQNTHKVT